MSSKKPSSGTPASGPLDSLGFAHPVNIPVTEVSSGERPPEDLAKMFPPIGPPGNNPAYKVNLDNEYVAGEIDPDRIFLPSFDSDKVLCKSCVNGLVIKSVHPGNRKEDGSPFTRTVGFCLASNGEPIELDDFRPVECSQYRSKVNHQERIRLLKELANKRKKKPAKKPVKKAKTV